MAKRTNKYGLSDYIPAPVRREVRQRCGFGCVVCGCAFIEYHHFNPPFPEAKEHRPEGITLLCSTCHAKVDKGIFDLDFVVKSDKNPRCRQTGFVRDIFYIGTEAITLKMGGAWFKRFDVVRYDRLPLISFLPPEQPGAPLRFNATFYDREQAHLFKVVGNQWIAGIEHYDIETSGNELVIREKPGDVKFKLRSIAEKEISIEKIDMCYKGFRIRVQDGEFRVTNPAGGTLVLYCPNIFATLLLGSDGACSIGSFSQ